MKKTLFLLLSVAFFASCNNEETPNPSGNSESKVDLPKTEIFVQGQNLLPEGAEVPGEVRAYNESLTRANIQWPWHTGEGWESARFSIRADNQVVDWKDYSSQLYFGRSPGKVGNNKGKVYEIYPYGHYNDRDLDYYKKDQKTYNAEKGIYENIGLFRYVYDPTGMKTQLPIIEAPLVEEILGDEKDDLEAAIAKGQNVDKNTANLAKVNDLLDKGSEYLNSHVLWYVVKEVGMRYGWHVNGVIVDYEVPKYEFAPDKVPDNVEIDIHQQEHKDWSEIKTSLHIRTDCESVTVNIPLKEEDILEQDDFAIRVFNFYYQEYTIEHKITHDEKGITIEITNIPAELIAQLKNDFGDGLTVEIHSYSKKDDIWEELKKSHVVKTGKACTVNGQVSSAFHPDDVIPMYIDKK